MAVQDLPGDVSAQAGVPGLGELVAQGVDLHEEEDAVGEGAGEIALGDGSGEIFGGELELTGEPVEIAVSIGKPAYELDFGDVVVHVVSWGGGGGGF